MFSLNQDMLVIILSEHEGVDLVSYGKPRDGFALTGVIPHWTSGFGGKYEIIHKNVPAGAMIAVGDLENLDITNQDKLKQQLKHIDIYPTGHSGDFTGKDIEEIKQWFFDRSVRDDALNNQSPIAHAQQLTPEGLGESRYHDLVDFLVDEMNIFKDPKQNNILVPAERIEREAIVKNILDGLSKTVRYTRKDDPAKAYQLRSAIDVNKPNAGTISFLLEDVHKIIVLRKDKKTGEVNITPLDKSMLGVTYVTKDGQPLGDRGVVDIATIIARAEEIESERARARGYLKTILTDTGTGKSGSLPPH
ncbi:MAG: hypothetical protein SFT92_00815 [Rickettsiales bacterium]|nr:hypothetical protein [Rickettsiales bacterium]